MDTTVIRDALLPLVGLPLFDSNRAADIQSFSFGREHDLPFRFPRPGKPASRKVGEYALHVQCAWRVIGPAGIEVDSRDLLEPAPPDADQFDWRGFDPSLRDVRMRQWLTAVRMVVDVTADNAGRITLALTNDYSLDVTPDRTQRSEWWRFFRAIDESPHFVMTHEGVVT